MTQIIHLATTKLSPEVVLHRTLADLKNIKSIVVLAQNLDGEWEVDHSSMSVGDLCVADKLFSLTVAGLVVPND